MATDASQLVRRPCPACGAPDPAPEVRRVVDPDAERYGVGGLAVPLRRCAHCAFRFFDLIEGVNTGGEIYAAGVLSAGTVRPRHRALADLVEALGPSSAGLELGCGACHVGRLLPPAHRLTAVDANPRQEDAPAHVQFVDADITALPDDRFAAGAFDWVLLDNVLEHLPAFMPLLTQAARWLAPGGRLLVSVPNGRTLKRWLGGRHGREVYRPVEHVNIFESRTLDAALARVGARVERRWLPPDSAFGAAVAASLLGWAPFGLYRVYRR